MGDRVQLSVEEYLAEVLALVPPAAGSEAVPLREASGRTLAEPVIARGDVPAFANSAMDGYAVRAADLVPGVELRVVDDAGKVMPRDGASSGHLQTRGAAVVRRYFKKDEDCVDGENWFDTGDIAVIHPDNTLRLTDRAKDVIKSGGEWIGSIDLENIAVAHPDVLQAACIGVAHPKWDERPLLLVVRRPGAEVTREELLRFFDGKIARFWMPDDVVFVDSLPIGGTGKIQKNKLREQFKGYLLPGA